MSIVSDTPGTTTDPVVKAMELLPVGAVTLVDTAGADDGGELGSMRVKRTDVELDRCDVALLGRRRDERLDSWRQRAS